MAKQTFSLLIVAIVISAYASALPRKKRQVGFACPQPDGAFAYTSDCSLFYQCDSGVATLVDCQPQLVFNSAVGYCDWPENVPNCPTPATSQLLKGDTANLCNNRPSGALPTEAFHVRHPSYCNAFYTCATGYIYSQCVFCPEDTYFSRTAGQCIPVPSGITDYTALCEGTQYVAHVDKVIFTLSESCWPYANEVNPWQSLYDTLRLGQPVYNPVPQYNPYDPYQG